MKYLLDTNVLSEEGKKRPHGGVLAWIAAHAADGFGVPAIALFEMQMGAEKVRENDPVRASQFEAWIARLEAEATVLAFDARAGRETARLLRGRSSDNLTDAMIAGIARVHGLTVATRNVKDFQRFGVPLVDPFAHR